MFVLTRDRVLTLVFMGSAMALKLVAKVGQNKPYYDINIHKVAIHILYKIVNAGIVISELPVKIN